MAVAVAIVAGSFTFVRATVRRQAPSTEATVTGPEGNRTSFVFGTRVSYPRRWSLVQLPGTGNPAGLFQLSNFQPHTVATLGCGPGAPDIPPRGVLLVVGQGGGRATGQERWPVPLRPEGGGCFSARWGIHRASMRASMIVGARAGLGARQDMLDAFHSIRFPAALRPGLPRPPEAGPNERPMFVVTSGYVAGRPSSYLAREGSTGVCLVDVVGSGPAVGRCRPIRMRGHVDVLGTGPWAVVTGVVSRRVASVRAVLAGGETVIGEVVPAPPLLHAPFDFFVVELPAQSRGVVMALDRDGAAIGQRPFDPPPLPVVARGGAGDTRWMLLDREQSNGVRCIDFDKGHGDQATICPTSVPESRDIQATVVPLLYGRRMVVGVVSDRVEFVQVEFLTERFVPAHVFPFPSGFRGPGNVLPPSYNLFRAPVGSIDGAIVVAYDRDSNPIDGMPLETAAGFGD